MASSRGRPPHSDQLTPAEWAVVEWVRHGLTNRQIAARRTIGVDAVKFHVGNALGKLGLADRRALRRWDGVRIDSSLNQKERTMTATVKLGPIGQISRTVRDIAESEAFYGGTLGLAHLYTFGDLAFFDCAGTRLYLQRGKPGPESVLYFQVADIHAAARAIEAAGVEITSAPHLIHRHHDGTEEWMAFFADPEGRPLALTTQAKPAGA